MSGMGKIPLWRRRFSRRASRFSLWFAKKKAWQEEIRLMLENGFKLEVESLISRSISYMTEEYVPQLLKEGRFLD